MSTNKLFAIGAIVVFLFVVLSNVFYTVREDKQALVLRFGEPVRSENAFGIEEDAGLKFKLPFVETVNQYDRKNRVPVLNNSSRMCSTRLFVTRSAVSKVRKSFLASVLN